MSASTKLSRRKVISTLIDLLSTGTPIKRVAKILAAYLIKTKHSRNVNLYIRDLELAYAERFGVATARVYSARKLSQQIRTQVKRLVKSTTNTKDVELIEIVDPSLIGGIIINTADAGLDESIRTKLQKLRSV